MARLEIGAVVLAAMVVVSCAARQPLTVTLTFAPSPEHATRVTHYLVDVQQAKDGRVVKTVDIGRPDVRNGEATALVKLGGVPAGRYNLSVRAAENSVAGVSSYTVPLVVK